MNAPATVISVGRPGHTVRVGPVLRAVLVGVVLVVGLTSSAKAAKIERFALIVGANDGGTDRVRLRYAAADARAMAAVLRDLGGLSAANLAVVLEPTQADLDRALHTLRARLAASRSSARREVLFYYSGHSNERGLLLQGKPFTYLRLRQAIRHLPAEVRIAVLDSCASGGITRVKGGRHEPPFLVAGLSKVKGHAFLTSAAANESAQESDALRGSYFTHNLVTGLRGAADGDRDGRITIDEAYRYAFDETLARTESTRAGPQHANYDMQLSGSGQVVLTDLRATHAVLELDAALRGRITVRNAAGQLVAELTKRNASPLQLGLPAGRYTVGMAERDVIQRGVIDLRPNTKVVVSADLLDQRETRIAARERGDIKSDATPEARYTHYPVVVTFFPLLGTGGPRIATNVSLGLFGSYYGRLRGVDLNVGGSIATDNVRGLQASVGFNYVGRELRGAQLTVGGNIVREDFKGLQASVGFNHIGSDLLSGAQLTSGVNVVARDVLGVQASVVMNYAGGDMGGFQGSSGLNIARGVVDGAQVGILGNIASSVVDGVQAGVGFNLAPELYGTQLGVGPNIVGSIEGAQVGLINIGRTIKGAQVGLINIGGSVSRTQVGLINIAKSSPVPVGLLNIVGDGIHHVEVWGDDTALLNLGLKLGGRHVYSLLATSLEPTGDRKRWKIGLGIGGRIPLTPKLHLDLDLLHWDINDKDGWTDSINFHDQARLALHYRLMPHLALFAGGTLNVLVTKEDTRHLGPIRGTLLHDGDTTLVRLWPGFLAGASF